MLKKNVIKYGTRNSLLTALMPTASTSQILGNNECFEFFTNNIYTRNTQAGDFILVNKYLVNDLIKIGLWNTELKDKIIADNGSIQNIPEIPKNYKDIKNESIIIVHITLFRVSSTGYLNFNEKTELKVKYKVDDFRNINFKL
jgi:ribonucleotide reductase alpha subunit